MLFKMFWEDAHCFNLIPNKQKGLCSSLVLKCENVHYSHNSEGFF